MSPDSRRVNFICDKDFYGDLEAQAQRERVSVGELIRRALEDKYPNMPPSHAITQIVPVSRKKRLTPTPAKAPKAGRRPRSRKTTK